MVLYMCKIQEISWTRWKKLLLLSIIAYRMSIYANLTENSHFVLFFKFFAYKLKNTIHVNI